MLGAINGADTDDWRRTFDINVLGLMYATHAVLPIMLEQGAGHIVNVSSLRGGLLGQAAGFIVPVNEQSMPSQKLYGRKSHRIIFESRLWSLD